jgi:hypothetical protein
MRNDARPIGHDLPHDPIPPSAEPRAADDAREPAAHDRHRPVDNRGVEPKRTREDGNPDPVMPAKGSTLKTRI